MNSSVVCLLPLTVLSSMLVKTLEEGEQVDIIYTGFSRAFNGLFQVILGGECEMWEKEKKNISVDV